MAHYVDGGSKGFTAATALTLGTVVKLNASGQVLAAAAATDIAFGVVTEGATLGRTVNVRLRNASGTSNFVCGGTVVIGSFLVSNASGQVVAATQTAAAGQPTQQVVGIAIEAGVAGQVIEAMAADMVY